MVARLLYEGGYYFHPGKIEVWRLRQSGAVSISGCGLLPASSLSSFSFVNFILTFWLQTNI